MIIKKYFSSVVMVFCLCALLVFTFGFLPAVLAAPPENRAIETITVESIPPEETFEHTGDAAQADLGEPTEQPGDEESLPTSIPSDSEIAERALSSGEPGDQPSSMPWDRDAIEPYPIADYDIRWESPADYDIRWESPNINAITREQVIEIAQAVIAHDGIEVTVYENTKAIGADVRVIGGAINTVQTDFRDARYIDSADPIGDPSWFVLFSELTGIERYVTIPEGTTPEEFLAANNQEDFYYSEEYYRKSWIGTLEEVDTTVLDNGEPVFVMATAWVRFIVVEINALTGEFIERGVLDMSGLDLPADAFYGDIRERFVPWPMG